MATAMSVADYAIYGANKLDDPISNLKLQKVLYYLNVIHLLDNDTPLITDVKFEKYDYGPSIKSVYAEYENYVGNDIIAPKQHVALIYDNGFFSTIMQDFKLTDLPENDRKFIDQKLPKLLRFDTIDLVELSQCEPQWENKNNRVYDDGLTKDYYQKPEHQFWLK